MKEKDPKVLEHRKRVRNELDKKRKQLFAKEDGQNGMTQTLFTNPTQNGEPSIATEQTSRFSQGNERTRKVLQKKSKTSQDVTSSLLQNSKEQAGNSSPTDANSSLHQSTNQSCKSLTKFTCFNFQSEQREIDRKQRKTQKQAKEDVCNFFHNLTKANSRTVRSKSGDTVHKTDIKNIPFSLLVSNFRRKKILDTIKSKKLSHQIKNETLLPYEEYIERVLD